MILLTGGSGCGKSSYAEQLACALPTPRYYIAAMKPFGEGGAEKIEKHRRMRQGKGFETIESYTDLSSLVLAQRGGTVLLECVCNLAANEMFAEDGSFRDPYDKVMAGIKKLDAQCNTLIIVTNDVGGDSIEYDEGTNAYIAALGKINAAIASKADAVYELVCGIPLPIKGTLPYQFNENYGGAS